MLEIADLWVNIDDKEVLKGINLRVPALEEEMEQAIQESGRGL